MTAVRHSETAVTQAIGATSITSAQYLRSPIFLTDSNLWRPATFQCSCCSPGVVEL
jgi:hypothetical protein